MKLNLSEEWYKRHLEMEDGTEDCSAGSPAALAAWLAQEKEKEEKEVEEKKETDS